MNEIEKRVLDAWIWEVVINNIPPKKIVIKNGRKTVGINFLDSGAFEIPFYTTDPVASDALDDKILEKCGKAGYGVRFDGEIYSFRYAGILVAHTDKKICRSLFAHKLFSKENP